MDTQHACICSIVEEQNLLPFIDAKIDGKFFPDAKHAQVYDMICDHYRQYGTVPSKAAVAKAYPTYVWKAYPDSSEFYLRQLRQDRTKVILTQGVQEFIARINQEDEGPSIGDDLEMILRQALAHTAHEVSQGRDTDVFLERDRIMARIDDRIANPGYLRGITTGLDGIDRLTGGFQDEQLITLIGTPKAGKSSLLLYMAYMARMNGYPVLFFTFEMSTEEQEDRLLSLMSRVPLTKILSGTLTKAERDSIERALRIRSSLQGFTITSDVSAVTLSAIQAKVTQLRPRIVFIDGVYMMEDEAGNDKGSPQALTSITRGAKRQAQINQLPYCCSTQALLYRSKGGLRADSVGYSSSFLQDSDTLLGAESHSTIPDCSKVSVIASRSGPKGNTHIRFDWGSGTIEELAQNEFERLENMHQVAGGALNGKPGPSVLQSTWGQDAANA